MLPPFDLAEPRTLPAALEVLANHGGDALPLAGGTNLLPDLRARRPGCRRFVSLAGVRELRRIDCAESEIVIGGRTTLSDLLREPMMRRAAPGLVESAEVFAGYMVRNAATVGGNICYASPSADLVPPLLALDARVTLASRSGERTVPLDEFYVDYKKTVRRPDELLTAIRWRPPGPNTANLFYKLGLRKGDAIAVLGVAVALTKDGDRCSAARIAIGSAAPMVFRSKRAEALLDGSAVTPDLIDAAARQAADDCRPIDDLRAPAEYRRHAAQALVRRLLTRAWSQLH